jgi:hypothetical protein
MDVEHIMMAAIAVAGANAAVLYQSQQLQIGIDAAHYPTTAILSSPPVSPLWLPDGGNLILHEQQCQVCVKHTACE